MDGAIYLNEHSATTCAIRVSNTQRTALHKSDAHHVFAVVAPGMDIKPILDRLALDLRVLQAGWDVGNDAMVYGGLGMVLADSPQRSSNCCHGGSASYFNCPHCLTTSPERLDWRSELEHGNTRSDSLNRLIVEGIQASEQARTAKADALRLMGICKTQGAGAERGWTGRVCEQPACFCASWFRIR